MSWLGFLWAEPPLSVNCLLLRLGCEMSYGRQNSALLLWDHSQTLNWNIRRCFCSMWHPCSGLLYQAQIFSRCAMYRTFWNPYFVCQLAHFKSHSFHTILCIFVTMHCVIPSMVDRCDARLGSVRYRLNSANKYFIAVKKRKSRILFYLDIGWNESIVSHNDVQFIPCLQL